MKAGSRAVAKKDQDSRDGVQMAQAGVVVEDLVEVEDVVEVVEVEVAVQSIQALAMHSTMHLHPCFLHDGSQATHPPRSILFQTECVFSTFYPEGNV
jgi:hypothetical protein